MHPLYSYCISPWLYDSNTKWPQNCNQPMLSSSCIEIRFVIFQMIPQIRQNKKENLCQRRPQAAQLNNTGEICGSIISIFLPHFFCTDKPSSSPIFLASLAIISHHIRNDFRFFSIFFPYFQHVSNFEDFYKITLVFNEVSCVF